MGQTDEPQLRLFVTESGADADALLSAPLVDKSPVKGVIIQTQRGPKDMENIVMVISRGPAMSATNKRRRLFVTAATPAGERA